MLDPGGIIPVPICVLRFVKTRQKLFLIALAYYLAASVGAGQQSGQKAGSMPGRGYHVYELYSWRDGGGGWNFRMLSGARSGEPAAKEVFDKSQILHGVEQLKRAISPLPAGSMILLAGRLPSNARFPRLRGTERLRYPAPHIAREIRRYSEARNIQVLGPGGCVLFSWQDPEGRWSFGISSLVGRKALEEVFEKETLRGLDQLKREIAGLTPGSTITWFSRLPPEELSGADAGGRLCPPPAEIVKEIQRYAARRDIEVIGP